MKRGLLSCCAILALGAAGASAGDMTYETTFPSPESSGSNGPMGIFGDLNLSGTYINGDVPKEFSLDLGGSIVVPVVNNWNAALDHQLGYRFEADDWFLGGTGHFFYNNGSAAGGVFVSADTDETYGGGVEAAAFPGDIDLIGKIGYFNASEDYWNATGTANVYLGGDPNTALSGTLGGAWGDAEGWQGDVGFEHRFNNSPFSGFAEIGYSDLGAANSYHVTGGARFFLGGARDSTLQDFNRGNPF